MASTAIVSEYDNMALSVTFETLPVEIVTYIMKCLTYDDISLLRAVSKFILCFPNLNILL